MSGIEGNVYLCDWAKRGKKFLITLQQDSNISVAGQDFDEAEEMMWELLCEKFGDGEAVVEYVKPLPKSAFQKKYGIPEILSVSGNGGHGRLLNEGEVLISRICEVCKRTLSQRTKAIAEWDYLPNSDGAVSFKTGIGDIYSEDFLSLFSDEEKSNLSLIPVRGPEKTRKRFFELLPGNPKANYVGVPRFPGLLNKRCETCKSFRFTYLHNNDLFQFIARRDLPEKISGLFVIGDSKSVNLCMTRERYQKIVGKKGTKDIMSRQIWVVPDNRFVRKPEDENYPEELYWKSRF